MWFFGFPRFYFLYFWGGGSIILKWPSTPQHTDSHPCTKPALSRSLSRVVGDEKKGWSRGTACLRQRLCTTMAERPVAPTCFFDSRATPLCVRAFIVSKSPGSPKPSFPVASCSMNAHSYGPPFQWPSRHWKNTKCFSGLRPHILGSWRLESYAD